MNIKALIGAISILSSQVIPNFVSPDTDLLLSNFVMHYELDKSNFNVNDTYSVRILGDEIRFLSDNDGSELIFSCVNYFTMSNIIDYCFSVSNHVDSVELNFDFISNFSYDNCNIYYTDESGNVEVYLFEGTYHETQSLFLELSNLDSLRDYDLIIELTSLQLDSLFSKDIFYLRTNDKANEFYLTDDNISLLSSSFLDYLIGLYYYNLGLEDGGIPPDATMYDLIYDFISNNLLRSEQDTGGLARILTDVSIVLIFITLIMLLVFVFKWCSHNILGG